MLITDNRVRTADAFPTSSDIHDQRLRQMDDIVQFRRLVLGHEDSRNHYEDDAGIVIQVTHVPAFR